MKTNKIIGVGIIGASAGSWALKSHLPALKLLDDKFRIVAVSTSNLESARATAQQFNIPYAFDNATELVENAEVDLVIVAVRVPAHLELVRAAISAGKMVFCEWPLGNGLKEAEDLAAFAKVNNVKTFCGLQATSLPEVRFLKDWLAQGNLGEVFSTTAIGGGNNWGTILESESQAYLVDPKNGATMLSIPFAHFLNGLQFTLGRVENFHAVVSRRNTEVAIAGSSKKLPQLTDDQIVFSATLANGIIASVNYHGGEWDGINLQWEIYGSKGKLTIKSPTGHLQFGKLGMEVAMLNEAVKKLTIPESYLPAEGGLTGFEAAPSRGLYYAYKDIFDDIHSETTNFPDFTFAVRHHQLISSIESQAQR